MRNEKLEDLVSAIKHISLNQDDLMEAVLDFSKYYGKNNPKDEAAVDLLFTSTKFIEQATTAAREAIVLAMHAITLDEKVIFKDVITHCVNIENQRYQEEIVCEDDDTKALMQQFLAGLRKELFSRIYSQNKEFNKVAKLSKGLLKVRYDDFMNNPF